MNTEYLENLGLVELNNEEKQDINGGGLFSKILGFIVGTAEYAYELSCLQGGTAGGRAGAWGGY